MGLADINERKKKRQREARLASSVDFERILISSHLCGRAGIQRGRESQGHLQWSISQQLHYHFKAGLCCRRPACDTGALWMMKHGSEMGGESLLPLSTFPIFLLSSPPDSFTVPHFLSVIYVVLPFLSLPFPLPLFFHFLTASYLYLQHLAAWMASPI